jgi:hypothetical protein
MKIPEMATAVTDTNAANTISRTSSSSHQFVT